MKIIKSILNSRASFLTVFILLLSFALSSCKKFLEIPVPKDRLVNTSVFEDDNSATSAIVGIYSDMMQTFKFISLNATLFPGFSADELGYPPATTATWVQFMNNTITPDNTDLNSCWAQGYTYIYDANAAIEGINKSTTLTPAVKNQLLGEAKFIRAFNYFYLVNLFGDVPLAVSTDYTINAVMPRTNAATVYSQIISDLKDAQNLLPAAYVTAERVRPNKWTATALLARAYLYTKDWQNAEIQSSLIINSGVFSLPALNTVFLKTSNETIWQLMPVSASYNTLLGFRLVQTNATSRPNVTVTNDLVSSFESGDARKTAWLATAVNSSITYYTAAKYKIKSGSSPLNEYFNVFRLGEQYLIRAEARAQQSNLPGAVGDINLIRARASLGGLAATLSQVQVLTAIEKERRIELFAEWGHRWFDLKRTGRVDAVIGAYKPTTWRSTAALWPVPLIQLNTNQSLVQNPGY